MTFAPVFAAARRLALPAWFTLWTIADISPRFGDFFASDTRIYYRATQIWLVGGDPWDAAVGPFHFAGLPPTVQLFVPFTSLPEEVAVWLGFAIGVVSAFAILRILRLPLWWLLFPPLAHGVIVANPHVWLTALLLTGRPWAEALAGLLKVYAIVPVAGRFHWRGVALTLAGLTASFAIAPSLWGNYLAALGPTTARLAEESAGGFSAAIVPVLLIPMAAVLLALALVDRPAASWLAVPALWPSSQFFTQTFAMPLFVAGGAPWLAAALAIPSRGVAPVAIAAYVLCRLWRARFEPVAPQFTRPQLPKLRLRSRPAEGSEPAEA